MRDVTGNCEKKMAMQAPWGQEARNRRDYHLSHRVSPFTADWFFGVDFQSYYMYPIGFLILTASHYRLCSTTLGDVLNKIALFFNSSSEVKPISVLPEAYHLGAINPGSMLPIILNQSNLTLLILSKGLEWICHVHADYMWTHVEYLAGAIAGHKLREEDKYSFLDRFLHSSSRWDSNKPFLGAANVISRPVICQVLSAGNHILHQN